jgi:monoamine oxidase
MAPPVSRRHALRAVVAGVVAPGIRATAAADPEADPVHIVGAGLAGMTAALRLVQTGQAVQVHEASPRCGGRVWTSGNFNASGMFVELGAEFVDSHHQDLMDLARELDVPLQGLREPASGGDRYHFGGRTYGDEELLPAFAPLAERVAADQDGLWDRDGEPTDLARELDRTNLADYLRARGQGIAPWVLAMLETAYVIEFGMDADRMSALNFVDFIRADTTDGFHVFGDSDEAWRLEGGNSRLCEALQRRLQGQAAFHFGRRLESVQARGSELLLGFRTNEGRTEIAARRVILALPFTMLRDVAGWDALALSEPKRRAIRELGYGLNVKTYHGFGSRPWTGRVPRSNGTVYADLGFQNCWETSRGQEGPEGILCHYLGGERAARAEKERKPDAFLHQLDAVFPGVSAAHDGNRRRMDWGAHRFVRASYTSPAVGQYLGWVAAAARPELEGRLLFAGEHTSEAFTGYMNGAIESGNRAAREAARA